MSSSKKARTNTTTVRRPARTSTGTKIVSASLATMTCVGLAGVLAVRTADESAAASNSTPDTAQQAAAPTSSSGMSQADLDAYAAQLDQERQQLADYRAQLVDVAAQLQAAAQSQGVNSPAVVTKPKVAKVKKPTVSQPARKSAPATKPQASTQGS